MDAPRGKKAFRTAAQDCRIAGLEAERAGVRRHRRAAFINDADDAERGCDPLDRKPVRTFETREHAAYRIGKSGDGVEAACHRLDAGAIERQPVEEGGRRAAGLGGRHVVPVGGQDVSRARAYCRGGVAQGKVLCIGRSERKRMGGLAGRAPDAGHDTQRHRLRRCDLPCA